MSWCVSWCLCVFNCSSSLDSVQNGATALIVASQNGHCEIVGMLLDAKADPNMKANVSCYSDGICALAESTADCVYCQC